MYILHNLEDTLLVTENFIKRSNTLNNLMEDLNSWNDKSPIPIKVDFEILREFYSIFQEIENIKCDGKYIFDYLVDDLDTYIERYPQQNKEPPFQDKIVELSNRISIDYINEYMKIADFMDMMCMTRFISLLFAYFIKNLKDYDVKDYDEKVEIFRTIRQRIGHIK